MPETPFLSGKPSEGCDHCPCCKTLHMPPNSQVKGLLVVRSLSSFLELFAALITSFVPRVCRYTMPVRARTSLDVPRAGRMAASASSTGQRASVDGSRMRSSCAGSAVGVPMQGRVSVDGARLATQSKPGVLVKGSASPRLQRQRRRRWLRNRVHFKGIPSNAQLTLTALVIRCAVPVLHHTACGIFAT